MESFIFSFFFISVAAGEGTVELIALGSYISQKYGDLSVVSKSEELEICSPNI